MMQKTDFLSRMFRDFDRTFAESCQIIEQNNSYDLIGSETSIWKFLVNEKGCITIETQFTPPELPLDTYAGVRRTLLTLFDPAKHGCGNFAAPVSHTLLDKWLPVSEVVYLNTADEKSAIECFYADSTGLLVKTFCGTTTAFYKIAVPQTQEPAEVWALPDPQPEKISRAAYDNALNEVKEYWSKKMAPVLAYPLEHEKLKNMLLASIVKAFLCQYNGALRYGGTRYYYDTGVSAESFPPTLFTMCEVCLFFGLAKDAGRFLEHFLANFISPDGDLMHRGNGASLSEHGMLLRICALYLDATSDRDFAERFTPQIMAVVKNLYNSINALPAGELLVGCPEDDLRDWQARPWYSCNLWSIRGLAEIIAADIPALDETFKAEIRQTVDRFRTVVLESCRANTVKCSDGENFIPPFAGWKEPFTTMNEFIELHPGDDIHSLASYTNYRFYPEMLSSMELPPEIAENIINFRNHRQGDLAGVTRFRIFRDYPPYADCFDNWPVYNWLQGLAHYGKWENFIQAMTGHAAHHQHRETCFAPEMSFKDRLDSTHCVPSQLLIPLALKELLSRR